MNYTQLIIRKREDLSKVFLFFPHTGIAMEAKCHDVGKVYNLLDLMKNVSMKEMERICHRDGISEEILEKVEAIREDLKSMDITFDKE